MDKDMINKVSTQFIKNKTYRRLTIIAIIAILLMSYTGLNGNKDKGSSDLDTIKEVKSDNISQDLEADLETALTNIDGLGNVSVKINYDGSIIKEYAYNEDSSNSSKDEGLSERSSKREVVLIDNGDSGLVVKEIYPDILGVIVVCDGAADSSIKEQIYNAVSTYLNIPTNKISVNGRSE